MCKEQARILHGTRKIEIRHPNHPISIVYLQIAKVNLAFEPIHTLGLALKFLGVHLT
jgi:hypothetical protein